MKKEKIKAEETLLEAIQKEIYRSKDMAVTTKDLFDFLSYHESLALTKCGIINQHTLFLFLKESCDSIGVVYVPKKKRAGFWKLKESMVVKTHSPSKKATKSEEHKCECKGKCGAAQNTIVIDKDSLAEILAGLIQTLETPEFREKVSQIIEENLKKAEK